MYTEAEAKTKPMDKPTQVPTALTPEELKTKMQAALDEHGSDMEMLHDALDKITWDQLVALGYEDAINLIPKEDLWYA